MKITLLVSLIDIPYWQFVTFLYMYIQCDMQVNKMEQNS